MAKIFLSLCVLALFLHGSIAEIRFSSNPWQSFREGAQNQCRFERLTALEPKRRVQSEGGVTEYFDDNDVTFKCSGVAVIRKTIQPQGLTLPIYFNAHHLIYVVKGRGIAGEVIPGCPETYQSSSGQQQQEQCQQQQCEKQDHQQQKQGQGQQQSRSASCNDQHQRIISFQQADILAVPAGIAHWCYNEGNSPLILIAVLDTSNNANQLDNNPDSVVGITSILNINRDWTKLLYFKRTTLSIDLQQCRQWRCEAAAPELVMGDGGGVVCVLTTISIWLEHYRRNSGPR